MRKLILGSLVGISLFSGILGIPRLAKSENDSIGKALQYLAMQQNSDGGLREKDQIDSGDLQTAWSMMAFASAGVDPSSVKSPQNSLVDYELSRACDYIADTDIERAVMALSSAGVDLSVSGCDLENRLIGLVDPASGKIGNSLISTIFGVFALKSQNLGIPDMTYDYIVSEQQPSGGWDSGWGTESNITAQSIQSLAILAPNFNVDPIMKAKDYLKSLQIEGGGIKYSGDPWVTSPDAFSDAYTLQAIYSLGESPQNEFWMKGGHSVLEHLLSYQKEDGSFYFSSDPWGDSTPVWTTAIVLPSLNQMNYPVIASNLLPFEEEPELAPTPVISPSLNPAAESKEPETLAGEVVLPKNDVEEVRVSPEEEKTFEGNATLVAQESVADQPSESIQESDLEPSPKLSNILGETSKKNSNPDYIYIVFGFIAGCLIVVLLKNKMLSIALIISLALFGRVHADSGRVGLLVRHSNGEIKRFCLEGETFPLKSEDLFRQAAIPFSFDRGFLVSLDNESALSAWQKNANSHYWSHWIDQGGGLTYANFGAQSKLIKGGFIDAWQIGSSEKLLADVKFEEICPVSLSQLSTPSSPDTGSSLTGEKIISPVISPVLTKSPPMQSAIEDELIAETQKTAPTEEQDSRSPQVLGASRDQRKSSKPLFFIAGFSLPIIIFFLAKKLFKTKKH
ncbi:MAG: prenyltransferase/squalene oxidase repeat-containing protein [bacterium]